MSTPDSLQALLEDSRQNKAEIAALRIVVDALIQAHPDSTTLKGLLLRSRPTPLGDPPPNDHIALVETVLDGWLSRVR